MRKRREFRPTLDGSLEPRLVLSTVTSASFVHVAAVNQTGTVQTRQANNLKYVNALYAATSFTPGPNSANRHAAQLTHNHTSYASRLNLTNALVRQTGFLQSEVNLLYSRVLGRAPESTAALNAWTRYLARTSFEQTLAQMFASNEFFARAGGTNAGYVTGIYNILFNRNPDPAAQGWVTQLNNGASRVSVANQILRSPEGVTTAVFNAYQFVLGRTPDQAGLQYFSNYLRRGGSFNGLLAQLLASDEYYNKVTTA